jgi:hypothetical protein
MPAGFLVIDPTPEAAGSAAARGAQVLSVKGSAQRMVVEGGKATWAAIRPGDSPDELSIIRTGLRSGVELQVNGARVAIGSASKVGICRVAGAGGLRLRYGSVRVHQAAGCPDGAFTVHTPAGMLALTQQTGGVAYGRGTGLQVTGPGGAWRTVRAGGASGQIAAMGLPKAANTSGPPAGPHAAVHNGPGGAGTALAPGIGLLNPSHPVQMQLNVNLAGPGK